MDWQQSRLSYYADFVLIPLIMLLVVWAELQHDGLTRPFFAALPVGAAVWSLLEYWIHRALFHHIFRREHWIHHKRPRAYVAAPSWLTALLHVLALGGFLGSFGPAFGSGLWLGLEAGYLVYIATHAAIHHRKQKGFGWLRRKWSAHMLHHGGAEVNFGVVSHFWDKVFGTYQDPRQGGRINA